MIIWFMNYIQLKIHGMKQKTIKMYLLKYIEESEYLITIKNESRTNIIFNYFIKEKSINFA